MDGSGGAYISLHHLVFALHSGPQGTLTGAQCITIGGSAPNVLADMGGIMRAASTIYLALAFGLIAFPAIAADLGTSWSGNYIGGNLGAAFDTNNLSIKDLSVEQDLSLKSSDDTQFIGGVHTGFNWQMGSWLVGVEGDFDFSDNINFLASSRGRLGWALGNWLLYGTGGVAFIDADNNFVVVSADDGPFGFSHSNNDTGFVVGGGVDYKVGPHFSLGVEGLFYDFGNEDTEHLVAGDEPFVLKEEQDFAVVRGRLTYHFKTGAD
jgi:outer membrane immunogenic protein